MPPSNEFDYLSKRHIAPINVKARDLKTYDVPMSAGMKLPSGAILLHQAIIRKFDYRIDAVVLCVARGYQPFVTWYRMISTDSKFATGGYKIVDTCDTGDYFFGINEALIGFDERVAKYEEMYEPEGMMRVK